MRLSLAYSPCPNDTFIFYAMIHGKVDTEGLEFDLILGDVSQLNQAAKEVRYDITKLSFHALYHLQKEYQLLKAGAALGNNCGPLLIAKRQLTKEEIKHASVAIPGEWTTANFLLDFAYPSIKEKTLLLFSDIEGAVLDDRVDLGVIIHENRFTYQEKGLVKIKDLGDHWENTTGVPIPLGGIALKQSFDVNLKAKVERVIQRSLKYAWEHMEEALPYLREHAQEMNDKIMMQHVNLYVNKYSHDLCSKGQEAVQQLFHHLDKK